MSLTSIWGQKMCKGPWRITLSEGHLACKLGILGSSPGLAAHISYTGTADVSRLISMGTLVPF